MAFALATALNVCALEPSRQAFSISEVGQRLCIETPEFGVITPQIITLTNDLDDQVTLQSAKSADWMLPADKIEGVTISPGKCETFLYFVSPTRPLSSYRTELSFEFLIRGDESKKITILVEGGATQSVAATKLGGNLEFDFQQLVFSEVAVDSVRNFQLPLRNIGVAPVVIEAIEPGCNVRVLQYPISPINPGDSAFVDLMIIPGHQVGNFRDGIIVNTREPLAHQYSVGFTGTVAPNLCRIRLQGSGIACVVSVEGNDRGGVPEIRGFSLLSGLAAARQLSPTSVSVTYSAPEHARASGRIEIDVHCGSKSERLELKLDRNDAVRDTRALCLGAIHAGQPIERVAIVRTTGVTPEGVSIVSDSLVGEVLEVREIDDNVSSVQVRITAVDSGHRGPVIGELVTSPRAGVPAEPLRVPIYGLKL